MSARSDRERDHQRARARERDGVRPVDVGQPVRRHGAALGPVAQRPRQRERARDEGYLTAEPGDQRVGPARRPVAVGPAGHRERQTAEREQPDHDQGGQGRRAVGAAAGKLLVEVMGHGVGRAEGCDRLSLGVLLPQAPLLTAGTELTQMIASLVDDAPAQPARHIEPALQLPQVGLDHAGASVSTESIACANVLHSVRLAPSVRRPFAVSA